MLITDQLESRDGRYSIETLSSIAWKNEFDFFEMDMTMIFGSMKRR